MNKKISLKLIFASIFVIGSAAILVRYNAARPVILVLQSYNTDYSWSRDVNIGLKRVFDGYTRNIIHYHYMDTKNHTNKAFLEKSGLLARRVIDSLQPNILIAVDDNAQSLVAKYYINHEKIKIVFAAVNAKPEKYGYTTANNVTGILERNQLSAIRDAFKLMGKEYTPDHPIRIANLGDLSNSVKINEEFIKEFDWSPVELKHSVLVETFPEWKEAVQRLENEVDFFFSTNYRTLKHKPGGTQNVPPEEVVQWTLENSKTPIIGSHGFFVEEGGPIAIATSPYEQGEVAARIAMDVIKGKDIKSIPIRSTEQFIVFMREDIMKKKGINIDGVYKAFAIATNNYYINILDDK